MRTAKDIEAQMHAVEEQRDQLKAKLRSLEAERNEAVIRERVAVQYPTEAEKNLLIKVVVGIASDEAVGTPGADE